METEKGGFDCRQQVEATPEIKYSVKGGGETPVKVFLPAMAVMLLDSYCAALTETQRPEVVTYNYLPPLQKKKKPLSFPSNKSFGALLIANPSKAKQ